MPHTKAFKKLKKGLPHDDLKANLPVDFDLQEDFRNLVKKQKTTKLDFDFSSVYN